MVDSVVFWALSTAREGVELVCSCPVVPGRVSAVVLWRVIRSWIVPGQIAWLAIQVEHGLVASFIAAFSTDTHDYALWVVQRSLSCFSIKYWFTVWATMIRSWSMAPSADSLRSIFFIHYIFISSKVLRSRLWRLHIMMSTDRLPTRTLVIAAMRASSLASNRVSRSSRESFATDRRLNSFPLWCLQTSLQMLLTTKPVKSLWQGCMLLPFLKECNLARLQSTLTRTVTMIA